MATAESYAKGLLDEPMKEAQASTYEAVQRNIDPTKDTVAGQMNTLLSKDSDYIKRAQTAGQQYAQSRGLLNSSIGAQATHAAAIDAAMPIAQQDADSHFRQGLENQSAQNVAKSTNVQLQTNISQSNAANQQAMKSQALQSTTAMDTQRMSDQAAMDRAVQGDNAAMVRTQFSELQQTGRQNLIAQTDIQTNAARITAEQMMNNQKVAAADRETFSGAFNEMSRQNDVELTKLAIDPALSDAEKNRLISAQNERYSANVTLLADLYQIPLDMSTFGSTGDMFTAPAPAPALSAIAEASVPYWYNDYGNSGGGGN